MTKQQPTSELQLLAELDKKLGVIIALLLRSLSRDTIGIALKEQIAILDGLGVRPVDIAAVVGKTSGHVNKELVAIRRSTKKK
jgi:hypothetical protein